MKEEDPGVKWFNTVFYPKMKTGRAVRYEEGVLPRFRKNKITLFTPWGPRYSWEKRGMFIQNKDKESEVLKFLATLLSELQNNMPGKSFRWLFLGADLYGTRINHLPEVVVANYFASFAQKLYRIIPMAEFKLWSEFDEEAGWYRMNDVMSRISKNVLIRAKKTARAMGRNSSAEEYLTERLAEAGLIEETLRPIKISCVARLKDDDVDWELPRLYFLPEHLHAPWL